MEKKYELIPSDKENLFRIKALKSFSNVKVGDIGGYVQSERNLSQDGKCWIYHIAKVYGDAKVYDDARVYGYAEVYDNAEVYGSAKICECAEVCGSALVHDNAEVCSDAMVYDNAKVHDHAKVYGHARVHGSARVSNYAHIYGNAEVYECAGVYGYTEVYNNAKVHGNVNVYGDAVIRKNAIVKNTEDYIVFKNWWSSGRYFTWTRSNNKWSVGCFYGSGKELIAKAYKDSNKSGREYERVVKYVESILKSEKD